RLEEHVVEQRRVVGLADLRGLLHGPRRQSDLAALDDTAFGEPQLQPFTLDRVAVLDRHLRMALREVAHLDAPLLGVVQLGRERGDRVGGEHDYWPANSGCRLLCLRSNTGAPSSICRVMPSGRLANRVAKCALTASARASPVAVTRSGG